MDHLTALSLLFSSAFLAATLLPAQSEAVLLALGAQQSYNPWALFITATVGNVLGSCVNWVLGRFFLRFQTARWFPLKPDKMEKMIALYQRLGLWSLLFAWFPIIGDPLTVVAGFLRTPFWIFVVLVTLGKAARYWLLTLVVPFW